MAILPKRIKRPNGREYWNLVEVKRVRGKVVTKYLGYLGKTPYSKQELDPELLLPFVARLLRQNLTDIEVVEILKKMGVRMDVWPITKILLENDRHLGKLFLRLK
ncbi:hypothetical protein B1B_01166 [mine drainage metagenome]|uniref:Uncharacterized protein n=1 Tax=mine drainage metagenome TaxID=410659 RepID=T1D4L3_9ZZZZ